MRDHTSSQPRFHRAGGFPVEIIYNEMIVFNDPEGATIVVIAGDLAVVVAAMWRPPN